MDDQTFYDLFASLSREIGEVKDGIGRIEMRLARQGGIINGGARQVTRMIAWSEEMDEALKDRDERISQLTREVHRLEQNAAARIAELAERLAKLEKQ